MRARPVRSAIGLRSAFRHALASAGRRSRARSFLPTTDALFRCATSRRCPLRASCPLRSAHARRRGCFFWRGLRAVVHVHDVFAIMLCLSAAFLCLLLVHPVLSSPAASAATIRADMSPLHPSFFTPHVWNGSYPYPQNATAGNTYKNMYEQTTMSSGLTLVILVNLVTSWCGLVLYRYFILREAGPLEPQDIQLLNKYPTFRSAKAYTPVAAYVRAAPPMRWKGWRDFFTTSESKLSRDAQVYLLFQRACIVITTVCAAVSTLILMPVYWWGGAVFRTKGESLPHSLMSLLKTDRGVFERFTSHNLPPNSPLNLLQLPVIVITALCVIVMYTVVKTAAGEERSISAWLRSGSSSSVNITATIADSPKRNSSSPRTPHWMLFARGLPPDIRRAAELTSLLEAIYPGQVVKVELVCRDRMSEARILRSISSLRNRLDYLRDNYESNSSIPPIRRSMLGRLFALLSRRRSTKETISELEQRIAALQNDLASRTTEPVRNFMGCAFISFRSPTAAASVLRNFPVRILERPQRFRGNGQLPQEESFDLTIGRHNRSHSEWEFPAFTNLYKGVMNLLPHDTRQRFIRSSRFAPTLARIEEQAEHRLIENSSWTPDVSPEVATARLRNMKAERAPKSGDIIWKNIGISFFERTLREMLVQFIVFAILIVFTSPVAMLTALKLIFAELALLSDPQVIFNNHGHHNGTFPAPELGASFNGTNGLDILNNLTSNGDMAVDSISTDILQLLPSFFTSNAMLRSILLAYLPVLMLSVVFALVPTILRLTCSLEGYPTHSAQEMSVFRKTSFYYLMNAVVLPSLALNTASEFLEMIYKQSDGGANVYNALPILQRLFSGDIAFFLCNYLVQLALTGSVVWLMRIPSTVSMMVRRRIATTPLDVAEAKCSDIFDYPRHYAYSVTVMSMCLLFGFMAPLVWYFAWLYFACKHAVDVYLIRYVHPKSHIDGRLPKLSANFILTWTVVSQLSLAVIFYLQGWVKAGLFTAIFCLLMLATCLSTGASVGNRILGIIGEVRDRAVARFVRSFSGEYPLLSDPMNFASSSSSGESLLNASESVPMLQNAPLLPSEIRAVERIEPDSDLKHFLSESDMYASNDFSQRPSSRSYADFLDDDGYESEIEAEEIAATNATAASIPELSLYGTCELNGDRERDERRPS
ncbi:phosphate transporter [Gracilaria domingensis]|nr:phosphate transporter [Gracilaria domingensis]